MDPIGESYDSKVLAPADWPPYRDALGTGRQVRAIVRALMRPSPKPQFKGSYN